MKRVYRLLTELSSRKSISQLTGALAKSGLSRRWVPHFAKTYNINVEEAEKPIGEYETINDFFTRRLKSEARTIHPDADVVVSSVDALITGMGELDATKGFRVKGQDYTVQELLDGSEEAIKYENGRFIVLYLSPRDYHRIHTPIAGRIVKKQHVPGKVYPVNEFGLTQMRRVLSRNERLITYIENEHTQVAVVKVGALNVSSIQFSDRLTSDEVEKGQELAYFEFGSTVVLLFEQGAMEWVEGLREGMSVKMGEPLARLKVD